MCEKTKQHRLPKGKYQPVHTDVNKDLNKLTTTTNNKETKNPPRRNLSHYVVSAQDLAHCFLLPLSANNF